MKRILLTFIVLILCLSGYSQTSFILVRHAEKAKDGTNNPPLNEQGISRAQSLATLLKNQEIAAVYSTPFKRTKETVAPLAEQRGLEAIEYHPHAKDVWLKSLLEKHPNETVVIVGHSNTIPGLANMLLGNEVFSQFDEQEYNNLLLISGKEYGKFSLIQLNF